ncbi:MAG TPA: Uma2 family endonuclease [Thermoanaerobaculia bacterium]|nr:Uma2 family endonuclease [Thermoanaerobaculia bacterium]
MPYTYAEYLAFEEKSDIRHEYSQGEIHRIAESTTEHSALSATVLYVIHKQLPAGCRGYTCSLRIRIPATGLSTYPDGAFSCAKTKHTAEDPDAITNPLIVFEVTGDNSEDYDRGEKLRQYQTIPELKEILIVSHREPRVSIHRRMDQHRWTSLEAIAGESVKLESIGGVFQVDDLYRD